MPWRQPNPSASAFNPGPSLVARNPRDAVLASAKCCEGGATTPMQHWQAQGTIQHHLCPGLARQPRPASHVSCRERRNAAPQQQTAPSHTRGSGSTQCYLEHQLCACQQCKPVRTYVCMTMHTYCTSSCKSSSACGIRVCSLAHTAVPCNRLRVAERTALHCAVHTV
jgi:hypothetical protein